MEPTVGQRPRLNRGTVIGLFRPLIADQGLVLVIGEDTHRHRLLAGCYLRKRISRLVEAPRDVFEVEAIKLVFQSSDFSVICSHLGIVAA